MIFCSRASFSASRAPLTSAGCAWENVEITRSTHSMTLVFRYNTDLFDEATIVRIVDAYTRMIRAAVAEPAANVSRVSLVDGAERARLLALGTGAVGSV